MVFSALPTEGQNQEDLRTDTRMEHGNKCHYTCTYFIPIFTSSNSTKFNDYIFEYSSEGAEDHAQDGFFGEQTSQRREFYLDKLTAIRLRDINMTYCLNFWFNSLMYHKFGQQ